MARYFAKARPIKFELSILNLKQLLQNDPFRMGALKLVASLKLPDCYIAAGFMRNLVWDYIHEYPSTKLNDVDVVYFDVREIDNSVCENSELILQKKSPDINWQVKNQALMHLKNNDRPYKNSTDAMTFWPEKETAVGAQLGNDEQIHISSPFGTESLFRGEITFNPQRDKKIFLNRLESKQWLKLWPNLQVVF